MKEIVCRGASCILFDPGPQWKGKSCATIGSFNADTVDAGREILALAEAAARENGNHVLLGPMNKNTWGNYRFVTWSDGRSSFPKEPENPNWFPDVWDQAGFNRIASYSSSIDNAPQAPLKQRNISGVSVMQWGEESLEDDLQRLHELSNALFAANPFFMPISWPEFQASFSPLLATLPPRYNLVARDEDGKIQAYVLAYPTASNELIIKTVASARKGCGSLLVDRLYERVVADGFGAVIHALMFDENRSIGMSAKSRGEIFRRYAVWSKDLTR